MDTSSASVLRHLVKGEGACSGMAVSPTASPAPASSIEAAIPAGRNGSSCTRHHQRRGERTAMTVAGRSHLQPRR